MGGSPARSAYRGEARGSRALAPARYIAAASRMPRGVNMAQLLALASTESPVTARSEYGEKATMAFGGVHPLSRTPTAVAMASPAPAESPASTMAACG